MAQSKIEWTETTWIPVTGCTMISSGSKNCYAERTKRKPADNYKEEYGIRCQFWDARI